MRRAFQILHHLPGNVVLPTWRGPVQDLKKSPLSRNRRNKTL